MVTHLAQITVVTNVVADAVFIHIRMLLRLARISLSYFERFQDRAAIGLSPA